MKTVKIIGVPEHFNFPWQLAIDEGAFEERGIDLQWTDIPEGTGRMGQLLGSGEADLAIMLTEGTVKSIIGGNPIKIVQEYVSSPLLWGIHVGAKSDFKTIKDLRHGKVAISRFGSGSHLMAFVNAQQQGWETASLEFQVVNDLEGAVTALENGTADYFMWEHFTTKPLVDNGTFRRLGDCPTPWPCFVVAASDRFLAGQKGALAHILEVINLYTEEFGNIPSIDRSLANIYGQKLEDVREWLALTQWSGSQIEEDTLMEVQRRLAELGLITEVGPVGTLVQSP
jgi:ABC-type nitrate/sulfonate/bicarbonate transport system substrate-binding protein